MNSNYVEGNSPSSTTSCSGNAILQQPQTYVHPWYLARRRLESTIQSGAESTQSPRLVTIGQKPTKLYLHHKCQEIAVTEDGDVYTLYSKGIGSNRPKITDTWRLLDGYQGFKFRPKNAIRLPRPVARQIGRGDSFVISTGRLCLECFLGRSLFDWEVCRHGSKGNSDNSVSNLSAGCQLNNIIDDVESGRIKTTPEQIQIAINRLTVLLSTTV